MLAYRYLTADHFDFSHKVTKALSKGWSLYGDPSYTHDAATGRTSCGQAVVKEVDADYHWEMKLDEL